jgi:hypothetical protein
VQRLPDSHSRCEAAESIARFLIEDRFATELQHLAQARILYVRSEREVLLRGFPAAAYICKPRVQGAMSAFVEDLLAQFAAPQFEGYDPDFLVRIDAACWDALGHTETADQFWRAHHLPAPPAATWPIGRERLIFHELSHIYQRVDKDGAPAFSQDDGRPVLALRPHDAELFHGELECYGPTVCGAVDTALAIAAGGRFEQRRRLQIAS